MRIAAHLLAGAAGFAFATPAFAQFNPGPNPIAGTVGAQSLTAGTGTINVGGAISITASGVALTMTGTSALINNGTIQTTGSGRAIDSNSAGANLTVTNNGLISAAGTDAFRVNTNSTVELTNSGTIRVTAGGQAIDWAAITSASNKLTNNAGASITTVGEDAVRPGTGGIVNNAGTIAATPTGTTDPSGSDGIDIRTFTGITVTNSGSISGRAGIATDGSNNPGSPWTFKVDNKAGGTITGGNGSGLNVDGLTTNAVTTVTNAATATIRGGVTSTATNGDGDGIDVDGVLNLTNHGDVLGYGAKGVDSGSLPNAAEGIAAGGGTITNGATGRIIGSTTAADAPGGDPARAGNGILVDNGSNGSGVAATSITNAGLIEGKSGFAAKMVGTFADTVTNQAGGTLRGNSTEAALQTGAGADTVTNAGTIANLGTGGALDLGTGDDSLTLQNGASITGGMQGGAGTDTLTFDLGSAGSFAFDGSILGFENIRIVAGVVTLSSIYSGSTTIQGGLLRFIGDRSGDVNFLSLVDNTLVGGHAATYHFDGTYTNVTDAIPTPEPGTLALLASGLLGILAVRRK